MADIFDVSEKVVLITGGFGQIGAEFVKEFHSRGARVAVASRSASDELLTEAFPTFASSDRLLAVPIDIVSQDSVEKALDVIEQEWGSSPNVLINNAGLDTQPSAPPEVSGPFENFSVEVFQEVVDVNLVGTFIGSSVSRVRKWVFSRRGEVGV